VTWPPRPGGLARSCTHEGHCSTCEYGKSPELIRAPGLRRNTGPQVRKLPIPLSGARPRAPDRCVRSSGSGAQQSIQALRRCGAVFARPAQRQEMVALPL